MINLIDLTKESKFNYIVSAYGINVLLCGIVPYPKNEVKKWKQ